MSKLTYEIVEVEGGFAYRVGDATSETFPSRDDARAAADEAAKRVQSDVDKAAASDEGDARRWHDEMSNEPGHETDVIKSGSQRY